MGLVFVNKSDKMWIQAFLSQSVGLHFEHWDSRAAVSMTGRRCTVIVSEAPVEICCRRLGGISLPYISNSV